jgi:adenylosuccinate lyase
MTTTTLTADLSKYAAETAADMGEDVAAAVRAMRDEPGEVARAIGCTSEEVIDWCREQGV